MKPTLDRFNDSPTAWETPLPAPDDREHEPEHRIGQWVSRLCKLCNSWNHLHISKPMVCEYCGRKI